MWRDACLTAHRRRPLYGLRSPPNRCKGHGRPFRHATGLGLRSLLRKSGLSGMLVEVDLKGRAQAYKAVLGELRDAMRADLAHTL